MKTEKKNFSVILHRNVDFVSRKYKHIGCIYTNVCVCVFSENMTCYISGVVFRTL